MNTEMYGMRSRIRIITAAIFLVLLIRTGTGKSPGEVALVFHMRQSQAIYDQSSYGEPPQLAIWLEDRDNGSVRTVFVTRRTATGKYLGKVECPVSLPVWISIFRKETGREDFPTPKTPFFDAVTGATPQTAEITVTAPVDSGRSYTYYVEMNVAGDYNRAFPKMSAEKRIDKHGNGQPSLIYRGSIEARTGAVSKPELIGRSHQYYFTTEVLTDLDGIDSAKEVFTLLCVEVVKQSGSKP